MSSLAPTPPSTTRVCIVSDDPLWVGALCHELTDDEVLAAPLSMTGFLLAAPEEFDIVVIDLPETTMAARDAVVHVREHARMPVVGIAGDARESTIMSPFTAGARGVVLRQSGVNGVRDAVTAVLEGGVFVDPAIGRALVELALLSTRGDTGAELTATELLVLSRFPQGLTNPEIAAELGISINTVKTHVRHILAKLGCHDRVQAARVAARRGLIP